jgi:hypothetical protein
MGLLKRIFGSNGTQHDPDGAGESQQFHETGSTSNEAEASRNAPRRELIQVVLRDTMRKHGIPSDWLDCRILSTISRSGRAGLHVNFVVRQAHEQLLGYVFAFQESFLSELARFEPRARDWLVGVGWEFDGHGTVAAPGATGFKVGAASTPAPASGRTPLVSADQVRAFAPTDDAMSAELARSEDDVQNDLKALFAIRDAAIAQTAKDPDRPDFEATRPFEDTEDPRSTPR